MHEIGYVLSGERTLVRSMVSRLTKPYDYLFFELTINYRYRYVVEELEGRRTVEGPRVNQSLTENCARVNFLRN